MAERPVALITGASKGIGAATALELARRGYDLALLGLEPELLENTAGEARKLGANVHAWPGDLADLEYARATVGQAERQFGRIDLLVNNACWRRVETMRQTQIETWERTLRICLTAPAFLAKWVAAGMEKRGRGVIINISSVRSRFPDGTSAAYAASKGAMDAMTYDLAALYGPRGIRVLGINPGGIDTDTSHDLAAPGIMKQVLESFTDRVALGRLGRPEEIARMIALLAGEDASYLTGTTVLVDGGYVHNGTPLTLRRAMNPEQF